MKLFITITALFMINSAMAQDTVKQKPSCDCGFRSINQVGLLEGDAKSSFLLQTINGIYYKTWSAGVGVGLDYYHTRSIPLFIDLRKEILKTKNTPFLYADAGISFTWADNEQKSRNYSLTDPKFSNGLFYDLGIGYRVGLKNNTGVLISAGYTYKKLEEMVSSAMPCLIPPCQVMYQTYDYSLQRLAIKLGWQF